MKLHKISTEHLIRELQSRLADQKIWDEDPPVQSDPYLRYLNLTTNPGFLLIPQVYQDLIRHLGQQVSELHWHLDALGAPVYDDPEKTMTKSPANRMNSWLKEHEDPTQKLLEAEQEIEDLNRVVASKSRYLDLASMTNEAHVAYRDKLDQEIASLKEMLGGTGMGPCQVCGCTVRANNRAPAEFWCLGCFNAHWEADHRIRQIADLVTEITKLKEDYDRLKTAANHVGAQSTKAHETLDSAGIPVCALGIGDRVQCLIARLKDKDEELIACHLTLERLAHEAKDKLKDPK